MVPALDDPPAHTVHVVMGGGRSRGLLFLFPRAQQHVSVFDTVIWFTDGLKSEFSGGLKSLDAFSRYDGCSGVSVGRFPINLGLGIGVPDRQYHNMLLAIVDDSLWRCTNMQSPCRQGLESIDLAEINFFSVDPR